MTLRASIAVLPLRAGLPVSVTRAPGVNVSLFHLRERYKSSTPPNSPDYTSMAPDEVLTSIQRPACGLMSCHFVTAPVTLTVFVVSYTALP